MPSRDTKSKLVGESFVIKHRDVLGDIVCNGSVGTACPIFG